MIEWTHRDEVALQKEITDIVANVTKNAFQSMGLAWLDTLTSEKEDEDKQEEQLEGDAIGSPRESICSDTFTLVSDKAARQRAQAAAAGQAPSVALEAGAASATETAAAKLAVAKFRMQRAAMLGKGTPSCSTKIATQGVMLATEPAKEEEAPAEVASPAVNSEVVQQFVAALLSLVQHCKFAKKP